MKAAIYSDIVILCGDIEKETVQLIDKHYSCPKIGVLGNHDLFHSFSGTSINNVHKKIININGISISGFQGSPIYKAVDNSPLYEESEVFDYVTSMQAVDLFVSHSQPALKLEGSSSNPHRGFLSLSYLLQERKTKCLLHGHIHENREYNIMEIPIISTYGTREIEFLVD